MFLAATLLNPLSVLAPVTLVLVAVIAVFKLVSAGFQKAFCSDVNSTAEFCLLLDMLDTKSNTWGCIANSSLLAERVAESVVSRDTCQLNTVEALDTELLAKIENLSIMRSNDQLGGELVVCNELAGDNSSLLAQVQRLHDLQSQNRDLRAELEGLATAQIENDELHAKVQALKALRAENKELEVTVALLDKARAANGSYREAAAEVYKLQAQNQQLEATAGLLHEVKEQNAKLRETVSQVLDLDTQNQQLQASAQLLDVVKATNSELCAMVSEVQELQAQNQQLQPTAALLEPLKTLNGQLREMVMQVGELQAQNQQLQPTAMQLHSVKEANLELQTVLAQVHTMQQQNHQLQAAIALMDCDVKDQTPVLEALHKLHTLHHMDSYTSSASTSSGQSSSPTSLPRTPSDADRCRIFVGGLNNNVDEIRLAQVFSCFGPVAASKIVRSAKGQQSRGYGFVTFHHSQHAVLAVETIQQLMALLKLKENLMFEKLTVDFSTSAHFES